MNGKETLESIKNRAQFFKKWHIIPTRILKCSRRKSQHSALFGSDAWALPCKTGYLVVCDGPSAIKITAAGRHSQFDGSPYHTGGNGTHFVIGFRLSYEEFESKVLENFYKLNEIEYLPELASISYAISMEHQSFKHDEYAIGEWIKE